MVRRNKVELLPPGLKAWLDAQLVARGFADYSQLAADLQAKGAEVSKSGLHRYGSKFELRVAQLKSSAEQARALVEASPDDEGAMSEALIRLTQEKLYGVLVEMDVDPTTVQLPKLIKGIADLSRAGISQKKWQIEVRTKAAERLKAVEAEARALSGDRRDVAMEMLAKVRAVYEGAL